MDNQFQHINNSHQKIIEVARELFMEFGYLAVSTRKIAEICEITQPTLYHHFKNKKALYVEVLKSELFKMQIALRKIINEHGDDIEKCLFQVTYHILINKPPSMGQMFRDIEKELGEKDKKEIEKCWVESYQLPIASIFEKGIKEGEIRNPAEFGSYPIPSAYLLLNLISSNNRDEQPQESKVKDQAKFYTNVLLYGLSPSDKGKRK